MPSQDTSVEERIHPSRLRAGDVFIFVTDEKMTEYLVVRTQRGAELLGDDAGYLIYFLPLLMLCKPRKGEDMVRGNLRLLCCTDEPPDHLPVMVVSKNGVAQTFAETTS